MVRGMSLFTANPLHAQGRGLCWASASMRTHSALGANAHLMLHDMQRTWGMMAIFERSCLTPILLMSRESMRMEPLSSSISRNKLLISELLPAPARPPRMCADLVKQVAAHPQLTITWACMFVCL